jgi:hypothetical protein
MLTELSADTEPHSGFLASYALEGFSAPSPVRVGCKFCCNPLLGQYGLLHTQSSMVSRYNSSQDKSVCRRVTEIARMPPRGTIVDEFGGPHWTTTGKIVLEAKDRQEVPRAKVEFLSADWASSLRNAVRSDSGRVHHPHERELFARQ